jgi:hypothetical protein
MTFDLTHLLLVKWRACCNFSAKFCVILLLEWIGQSLYSKLNRVYFCLNLSFCAGYIEVPNLFFSKKQSQLSAYFSIASKKVQDAPQNDKLQNDQKETKKNGSHQSKQSASTKRKMDDNEERSISARPAKLKKEESIVTQSDQSKKKAKISSISSTVEEISDDDHSVGELLY